MIYLVGPITFSGELDRLYQTKNDVSVKDFLDKYEIKVSSAKGLSHIVVWNPWTEKAAAMADLGADQHPLFVCVEPGYSLEKGSILKPGQEWISEQRISYSKL